MELETKLGRKLEQKQTFLQESQLRVDRRWWQEPKTCHLNTNKLLGRHAGRKPFLLSNYALKHLEFCIQCKTILWFEKQSCLSRSTQGVFLQKPWEPFKEKVHSIWLPLAKKRLKLDCVSTFYRTVIQKYLQKWFNDKIIPDLHLIKKASVIR